MENKITIVNHGKIPIKKKERFLNLKEKHLNWNLIANKYLFKMFEKLQISMYFFFSNFTLKNLKELNIK